MVLSTQYGGYEKCNNLESKPSYSFSNSHHIDKCCTTEISPFFFLRLGLNCPGFCFIAREKNCSWCLLFFLPNKENGYNALFIYWSVSFIYVTDEYVTSNYQIVGWSLQNWGMCHFGLRKNMITIMYTIISCVFTHLEGSHNAIYIMPHSLVVNCVIFSLTK